MCGILLSLNSNLFDPGWIKIRFWEAGLEFRCGGGIDAPKTAPERSKGCGQMQKEPGLYGSKLSNSTSTRLNTTLSLQCARVSLYLPMRSGK